MNSDGVRDDKLKSIAMDGLLRRWLVIGARNLRYKPGAWDYDKDGARLVEDTARLLEVDNPWEDA